MIDVTRMRYGVRHGKEDILYGMTPYGWKLSRDRRARCFNRRGRQFSLASVFAMLRERALPPEAFPRERKRAR